MVGLISGTSPRFRAPWKPWSLTLMQVPPATTDAGRLHLRLGYSTLPPTATIAERIETLQRRTRAGDPVATAGDLRAGIVPVVLLDGTPIAAGWGRLDLPVTPGRHLLEVQTLHSRTWRAIDINPGRATRLDYIGVLGSTHRRYANGPPEGMFADFHGHTLGPRGRLDYWQYAAANWRQRSGAHLAMAFAMFGLGGAALAVNAGADQALTMGAAAAVLAVLILGLLARLVWTHARHNRGAPAAPLDTRATAAPATTAPLVLDPDGTPPAPAAGTAAVILHARFVKTDLDSEDLARQLPPGQDRIDRAGRRRLDTIGEIAPIRHRFAVPPPRIELDGRPVAASWTRMYLTLPAGTHRLTAQTPAAPLPVTTGDHHTDTRTLDITADPDQTLHIGLTMHVSAVPDPHDPVLHAWECHIDHLTYEAPQPPRSQPRVDVRGGLRRAATELNPAPER